jgi:hypothetical protein
MNHTKSSDSIGRGKAYGKLGSNSLEICSPDAK